jgi:hypothetical protein
VRGIATKLSASKINARKPAKQFAFAQKLPLISIRAEIVAEVAARAVKRLRLVRGFGATYIQLLRFSQWVET